MGDLPETDEAQDRALAVMGNNRIPAILEWHDAGMLTADRLNALLAEWWVMGEGHSGLGVTRLVRLFRAAGFVTDTPGTSAPAGEATVYRGASWAGWRGVSWTRDRERAEWFGRRYAHLFRLGVVLAAEIPSRHVLGVYHGRQEAEVIVNPRGLRNLRELRRIVD